MSNHDKRTFVEIAYDRLNEMLAKAGYDPSFSAQKNLALALEDLARCRKMLAEAGFAEGDGVEVSQNVHAAVAELQRLKQSTQMP